MVHVGAAARRRSSELGGLEDEPIGEKARKHVSDDRLRECGATEDEIKVLRTRRVELNALSTEQLVDAGRDRARRARRRRRWSRTSEILAAAWRGARAHADIAAAIERANRRAVERWQDAEPPGALEEQVREALAQDPAMSWNDALQQIAKGAKP